MVVLSLWRRVLAIAISAALLLAAAPALSGAASPVRDGASGPSLTGADTTLASGAKSLATMAGAPDDAAPVDASASSPGCPADSCPHLDLLPAPGATDPVQFPARDRRGPTNDPGAPLARAAGPDRPPRT